jgi:phytoene synthase
LTNILRDVGEDAARDRIYIPQEELQRFSYSEQDLMNGVMNESFRELMRFQTDRARRYFEVGRNLIPLLSQDSRACTSVLIEVYSSILDRIVAADYDVFSQRIGLSTGEKLVTMARLWALNSLPGLNRRL